MIRVSTSPLPLFACRCGHTTWAISHQIDVQCVRCKRIMKCKNYDSNGKFLSTSLEPKKRK